MGGIVSRAHCICETRRDKHHRKAADGHHLAPASIAFISLSPTVAAPHTVALDKVRHDGWPGNNLLFTAGDIPTTF